MDDHYWTRQIQPIESPGLNFINLLTRSFYASRSEKRKKLLELTVIFVLLGSLSVKAAHKHVDEIDPKFLTSGVFYHDRSISKQTPIR